MRPVVNVLYEDARSRVAKEFGPHVFVCACVADRLSQPCYAWDVEKRVGCVPRNGVTNVRKTLIMDFESYRAGGTEVVAVVDGDEVRPHLKLPADACRTQVVAAMKSGVLGADTGLEVVILEQNLETLLALAAALENFPYRDAARTAVERKQHADRDLALMKLAHSVGPDVRSDLLRQMPSADRLVAAVTRVVARTWVPPA